jgi:thiamine biosynthesis lipoprotein ApbE
MNNRHQKKGIINQVKKRFQTTIIGGLARFEESFGYLWGHNSDRDLTEKQKEFADMWEYVRTSILNHGNDQMRQAIDEIIDHVEKENSLYRYNFIIKNTEEKEQR